MPSIRQKHGPAVAGSKQESAVRENRILRLTWRELET